MLRFVRYGHLVNHKAAGRDILFSTWCSTLGQDEVNPLRVVTRLTGQSKWGLGTRAADYCKSACCVRWHLEKGKRRREKIGKR